MEKPYINEKMHKQTHIAHIYTTCKAYTLHFLPLSFYLSLKILQKKCNSVTKLQGIEIQLNKGYTFWLQKIKVTKKSVTVKVVTIGYKNFWNCNGLVTLLTVTKFVLIINKLQCILPPVTELHFFRDLEQPHRKIKNRNDDKTIFWRTHICNNMHAYYVNGDLYHHSKRKTKCFARSNYPINCKTTFGG